MGKVETILCGSIPPGIMECTVHYRVVGRDEVAQADMDGKALVEEDSLVLSAGTDRTVVPFRRMTRISESGRTLMVTTLDGEVIAITKAGFKHDDLRRALMRGRNSLMLRDRLIEEAVVRQPFRSSYEIKAGSSSLKGEGELSLYERSLVISPDDGQLFRVRLALISKIERSQHRLVLQHRHGSLELFKMGAETDPITNLMCKRLAFLREEAGALLRQVLPGAASSTLGKVTDLMMDGRAASGKEVKEVDPGMWSALVDRVRSSGLDEEFMFLSATSGDHVRIGLGKGERDSYIWFLAPMSTSPGGDPKVIAFEAESSGDQGRATYLFSYGRMAEFTGYDDTSAVTETLAEALRAIGLRREPVMMSELEMHRPENARYLNALYAMPELVALRKAFVGRAVHDERWMDSVQKVLDRA